LLIRSRHFETATDPDSGNHVTSGAERAVPWVAISPVVNAIRLLERLVPEGGLLFDTAVHDFVRARHRTGSLGAGTMCNRIEDFVAWANTEATAHGLPHETIPPDPHGKIGTARFRRTLAWHIARQPGGLVALAIQYGHMRTALNTDESGHYGTRSRGGVHGLIDIETALATADAHRNPERSNGALTIVALAIEADVPRNALTQRHLDLKNEFYEHLRARGATPDVETRLRRRISELKKTIANKNDEIAQLRTDVQGVPRGEHQTHPGEPGPARRVQRPPRQRHSAEGRFGAYRLV
jgi:hypothetical protein